VDLRLSAHGNLKMFVGIEYPEPDYFGYDKPIVAIFGGVFHNQSIYIYQAF
jgi:hypothetical protein